MMLDVRQIRRAIPFALDAVDLPGLGARYRGKVRDWYRRGDQRILITTDRLSAFDRILARVPYKGQVLNELSAYWFEHTDDIVANHVIEVPDPNVTVARECTPYPVEVVVRGFITGVTTTSLWYHYDRGVRELYGVKLPDGLRKNDRLPAPIITPTTKASTGHDELLTPDEVLARGLIPPAEWSEIQRIALALFARGQDMAGAAGLILVDTKYEFGRAPDGTVTLIDEIHTPDSSRFWLAPSYPEHLAAGQEPESFDKELVRLWYAGQGYTGEGEPPAMPEPLVVRTSERYVAVYEMLTGHHFLPAEYPAESRISAAVMTALSAHATLPESAHTRDLPRARRHLTLTPDDSTPEEDARSDVPEAPAPEQLRHLVPLLMGSKADLPHAQGIAKELEAYGVTCEYRVASAHKSVRHLLEMLAAYEVDPRPKVYITVAGRSNALSGLVDANVTGPVIACPPASEAFGGADVLSSLRMPSGVAPAVVLEPAAAALLAAKIIGLQDAAVRARVRAAQEAATERLTADDRELRGGGGDSNG